MELLLTTPGESLESLEQRLLLARELGHKSALLLFTTEEKERKETTTRVQATAKKARIKLETGLLVTTPQAAKKAAPRYDAIVAPATRNCCESKHVTHLLNPEASTRADFIHHRNSGLHQVLLKLCQPTKKKNPSKSRQAKTVLSSTSLLLQPPPGVSASRLLGRMRQNARWCKKYKVPYVIVSGARDRWEQRANGDLAALRRELLTA